MFVCFKSWFFSQTSEISQIQELNQLIVKETAAFDLKKASLNNEIAISKKRTDNLEMLSSNFQLKLSKFEVNQSNIDVFNSLKDKIFFVPTDYLDKKSKKTVTKLNDNFKILLDTNYFMVGKNLVYYEKDKRGKAIQLKELELDSKTSKMIQKLNFKEIYSPISNSKFPADLNITAAFLFNLTGVNEDYFLIKNEIGKMKDSISIEIDFIKTKTKKIEELQKDFASTIAGIKDKIKALEEQQRKIEDEQIRLKKIEQEKAIAKQNSEIYKCKNINGVDIYLGPILIKEFRNGDIIREARTPGEWEDFVKNKTPAYKYIDFDSKNSSKGLVYNYFAYLDNREIAPIGFHKMNILDFVQLEEQKVGEYKKVTEDCWCENGKAEIYERCPNCNYWTDTQKKYNVCSKCKNTNRIERGMKKCDNCNGTTKVFSEKCENCNQENLKIEHCIENNTGLRRIGDSRTIYSECMIDYEGQLDSGEKIIDHSEETNKEEFCFFLLKNTKIELLTDNAVKIGQLQMMNTLLNVTKFKNGDPIQYIEDKIEWELANKNGKPAYCHYNNDKSNPCFYNRHAINDKRGLLPGDWRMISGYDISYVESFFNKEISFLNGTLPFKKPEGYRNEIGQFLEYEPDYTNSYGTYEKQDFAYMNFKLESDYFNYTRYKLNQDFQKQGGYVLCVRRHSNFDDVNSVKAKNSYENNQFGSSGSSGSGNGRNDVSINQIGDGAFGSGASGSGSGSGPGKSRTCLNNVSLPSYDIDYDCNISFKLTINENGDVESASCIKSRTTCVDQRIINQVISEIVKQVKYDKSIGSNLTFAFLTISISSR
jgi:hypothetical protein